MRSSPAGDHMRLLRVILPLAFFLSACQLSTGERRAKSIRFAEKSGLRPIELQAGAFTLQGFERMTDPAAPVRIFIEGDGKSWLSRDLPSPDPTPQDPTALMLAGMDTSPNIAYVARPCQFITSPHCAIPVWTVNQYHEHMIAGMSQALDRWKGRKLELVGYSGGAAVALLLAARRSDVASIRTVAGNTDTAAFNRFHRVSPPAAAALNPAAFIARTAYIPQIHFAGGEDKVVPVGLVEAYQATLPPGHCSRVIILPRTGHLKGWPEHWRSISERRLPCTRNRNAYR